MRGRGYYLNVPLPAPKQPFGPVTDNDLLLCLDTARFTPDLILISAGFDSRANDFLGDFSISDDGFYRATERIVRLAEAACGVKIVSALNPGRRLEIGNPKITPTSYQTTPLIAAAREFS